MRDKRLHNESVEDPGDDFDLALLVHSRGDPLDNLSPGLVDGQQTCFASPFDELVGLGDEIRVEHPWMLLGDLLEALWVSRVDHLGSDKQTAVLDLIALARSTFLLIAKLSEVF